MNAQREAGWLHNVKSDGDGTFDGLDAAYAMTNHASFQDGSVLVLTQIFDLLIKFIGLAMTEAVVREAWPQAPVWIDLQPDAA